MLTNTVKGLPLTNTMNPTMTTGNSQQSTAEPSETTATRHDRVLTILTDIAMREQQTANSHYCAIMHATLFGVDHVSQPDQRCTTFAESNHRWTNLRTPTNFPGSQQIVSKSDMTKLYQDLHYWNHVIKSFVEVGTKSLHKHNCLIEQPGGLDPCTSVSCDGIRVFEQEMYCRLHNSVAPYLKNLLFQMGNRLGIAQWVAPTYDVIDPPTPEMSQGIVRLYAVVISHYITKELEIARNVTSMYIP